MRDKRIQGLIQGLALGDAFGMATEMMDYQYIKETIGRVTLPLPSFKEAIILKNQPAFTVTDDTYNALMIFEMLKENDGIIDTTTYLNKLIHYAETHPNAQSVVGPSTRRALESIKNGKSPSETGIFGTTNGASMKIAPVGIYYSHTNLPQLIEAVYSICLPTHNTNIAITGASIIAALASYLIDGNNDFNEMKLLIKKTISLCKDYGFNLHCASIDHRIDYALNITHYEQDNLLERLSVEIGTGLETIETVPTALAIFFYSKGDPLLTAQLSASIGGDTDTIGAISTALAGAMNPELIPQDMIENIMAVNDIVLK